MGSEDPFDSNDRCGASRQAGKETEFEKGLSKIDRFSLHRTKKRVGNTG